MLNIIVLGAAAGGGVPQWNCGCAQCAAARHNSAEARTQASLALSVDGRNWFLVNASPDLRQQINQTPALYPRDGALRDSPIAGVILTNGEVDAIAGLLSLREKTQFSVYAHQRVLDILDANPIFEVLDRNLVARLPLAVEIETELALPDGSGSGLTVTAFRVAGKSPLYLEGIAPKDVDGDTLGLSFTDRASGESCHVLTACARIDAALEARLNGAKLVFFDGTVWHDDELIRLGLGTKTGQRMGHMAMADSTGTMAAFDRLDVKRKVFVHINNSNPVLLDTSPERQAAEARGWVIPPDGMEFSQ
jgi:pyrroloquinoline quinone biosynthesis protein B